MNTIAIYRATLIALALPFTATAQMIPANDRVRVEVQIVSQSDHKELAKTTADQVTQHKTLNIVLNGKPKNPETRTIKWATYGRNMKSNNVQQLESGELKLGLTNGRQTTESKRTTTTYTPMHTTVSTSRNSGRGRSSGRSTPKAKRVEATGTKFAGYSVQVLDGGKVVGEKADPENIGKPKQP